MWAMVKLFTYQKGMLLDHDILHIFFIIILFYWQDLWACVHLVGYVYFDTIRLIISKGV